MAIKTIRGKVTKRHNGTMGSFVNVDIDGHVDDMGNPIPVAIGIGDLGDYAYPVVGDLIRNLNESN